MYDMDRTEAEERLPNGREAEFPSTWRPRVLCSGFRRAPLEFRPHIYSWFDSYPSPSILASPLHTPTPPSQWSLNTLAGCTALQHHVVAMHGADARKAFFNNKDLNLSDGYRLLVGGGPKVKDINANAGEYGRQFFLKNLLD
ncbi:hypothetical protein C8R44DRAFT_748417 [Mycena epipterygia]|nr:hypothetical protein C8R44DRAFT_748417 [Mycena epipterygia]